MLKAKLMKATFTLSAAWPLFAGAVAIGALAGAAARGPQAATLMFALLLLSATVVALAQQTLP